MPVLQASQRLIRARKCGDSFDTPDFEQAHSVLFQAIRKEDEIPAALGNAAENLSHKVAALLHKWSVRCPDMS
eukprot:5530971-Alexandrium_andersonii.AAC.1